MAQIDLGSIKFNWKGSYSGATAYVVDDVVESSGSSYICILATTGNAPPNATYWEQMSQKGTDGTNGTDGTDLGTVLTTQGDLVYRDGSGLQRLPTGTSGQALLSGGSGANLSWGSAGKNIVANTDTIQVATTSTHNLFDPTIIVSKGANSYYVVHSNIILGTNETGSMDDWNYRFNIQYSTDGGSSWSNGQTNAYSTDVVAFGEDNTHGRTYDSFIRTANGRFQISGTSAGTSIRFRVESRYTEIQNSRTLYYNRSNNSNTHRQFSSIIVYEE
jgi:hypothetical protein